ncbi:hypothetical protein STAFG_3941 [Streptomyces afghaniensis 772]|uniref:Uncharacterized protein n=1 Tax=Streptomyces afghaniensis 772 TaxID=1283301 RepID=S4MQI8_9ACTN|nr:hypothetical protein STAFG_3941 [Streptomyces afghaniensis 772]
MSEPPHAGRRLGPRRTQPGQKRGPVRHRRHPGRPGRPGWDGEPVRRRRGHLRRPRRTRHRVRMRTPRLLRPVAVHRLCPLTSRCVHHQRANLTPSPGEFTAYTAGSWAAAPRDRHVHPGQAALPTTPTWSMPTPLPPP